MARVWSLPENITLLIECHSRQTFEPQDHSSSVISLSAILPGVNDEQWSNREKFSTRFEELVKQQFSMTGVFDEVDAGYNEIAPMMKLSGVVKPLAASWTMEPAAL